MNDKQAEDWSNYWQGRTASEAGAALVGVGIENDAEIHEFWQGELSNLDKNIAILDIACGAGSVVRIAEMQGFSNLTGADISEEAIEVLRTACPTVTGVVTSASKTPFDDCSFDMVVSQFGFEYAGVESVLPEITRILKHGGRLISISHKAGSVIEQEVREKGDTAQSILDTQFIPTAKQLFTIDKTGGSDVAFNEAVQTFRPAQDDLLKLAKTSGGLAAYLYSGTQTLFQKRQNYHLSDITGWLDGMENEISAYVGRMRSMMKASLGNQAIESLKEKGVSLGLVSEIIIPFKTSRDDAEIGWCLKFLKI